MMIVQKLRALKPKILTLKELIPDLHFDVAKHTTLIFQTIDTFYKDPSSFDVIQEEEEEEADEDVAGQEQADEGDEEEEEGEKAAGHEEGVEKARDRAAAARKMAQNAFDEFAIARALFLSAEEADLESSLVNDFSADMSAKQTLMEQAATDAEAAENEAKLPRAKVDTPPNDEEEEDEVSLFISTYH